MPVTSVTKDPEALTMTLVGDFPVPVERLWEAYRDRSQLERFWGPPGWPATFTHHDLRPGGRSAYYMTGPDGDRFHGYWEVVSVEPGTQFVVRDGFAHADGSPNDEVPSMELTITFESTGTGSRFVSVTRFDSAEQLEEVLAMGAEEGATLSIGQLDILLEDLRQTALGKGTRTEVLTDTRVRITRFLDHPRDGVWEALTRPELVRRWLLGPEGWSMPVCEIDLRTGGAYRYGWEPMPGTDGEAFGFDGETLLVEPPFRWVTTEAMSGSEHPPATNDVTLLTQDGGTLLTYVIEYPDAGTLEAVLGTGMTEGMEASFARLEGEVLSA